VVTEHTHSHIKNNNNNSMNNNMNNEEEDDEEDDMQDGDMPAHHESASLHHPKQHAHAKHHTHTHHTEKHTGTHHTEKHTGTTTLEKQQHAHTHDKDSAANKIQLHWKKTKHAPVPSASAAEQDGENDNEASSFPPNPVPSMSVSPKPFKKKVEKTGGANSSTTASSSNNNNTNNNTNNKKTSRNKKGDEDTGFSSGKTKTVPAPSAAVLEWMRNLTVKRARRSIAPGMRVKVRFATKVKREGKVVRKKKWFGGRVSAVSKEGSKVRIKYDDNTAEVTKFPDKDIVVDDTFNGQHQAPVDRFLPPEETEPQSDGGGDEEKEDEEEKQAPVEQQEVVADVPAAATVTAPTAVSVSVAVGKEVQKEELSVVKPVEPPLSTTPVPVEKAADVKEIRVEKVIAEPRKQAPPAVAVESTEPVRAPETEKAVKAYASPSPESSPKPKKKRGRPPKHRPVIEESPSVSSPAPAVRQESAKEREAPRLPVLVEKITTYKDSIQAPAQKETKQTEPVASKESTVDTSVAKGREDDSSKNMPTVETKQPTARQHSKLSLTIRIPARKKEDQQQSKASRSPRKSADEDMADETANGKPSTVEPERLLPRGEPVKSPKSKKRVYEEGGGEAMEQPSKRLHIHIPYAKTTHEAKESKTAANREQGPSANLSSQPRGEIRPKSQAYADEATHKPTEAETGSSKALSVPVKSSESSKRGLSPLPPSLPSKKMRRKSLEAAGADELSESVSKPGSELSLRLPKASKSNKAEMSSAPSIASGSNMREEEITANLTRSTNSAFDSQEVEASTIPDVSSEASGGKVLTPHGRSKQEVAPAVRSGRRAAQQANERIVSRQEVVVQDPVAKKKRKNEKRRDGEPPADSDDSDDSQWVQCDSCSKWRIIPGAVVATLPKQWYCANNTYDPKRSSCDAPEQTPKQVAKEKRKRKRQRLLQAVAAAEGKESGQSDVPKEMPVERERPRGNPVESVKPRQPSPVQPSVDGDSGSDTRQKAEKKPSGTGLGKKAKSQESLDLEVFESIPEGEVKSGKPRGRPRRSNGPNKGSENTPAIGGAPRQTDEAENLEWVQCERCDKWRKLPPHVSADELPDVWYCNMNTWNPSSAACDAPEDKADGLQDTGVFGVSGSNAGKLSYRNLIFGSNGRKQNRPISERTRAAESLFATPSDDEAPPSVMYANSSAFVSRSKSAFVEETEEMSVLELMSHSNLWAELRGVAQPSAVTSGGVAVKQQRVPFYSFDSLPSPNKDALKDLLLHSLDSKTLTGDEVHLDVQGRQWENVPEAWLEIRSFCSLDVVITALCELVKEGKVDCVQSLGPNWTVKDWNPRYRRAREIDADRGVQPKPVNAHQSSRCMKIAKPWKRARIPVD
jgi:hypothetical protein